MKPDIPEIDLSDYQYKLEEDRIANQPLKQRDECKLLYYSNKSIEHHQFKDLHLLLPKQSSLFFNDTKVIHARLVFFKSTGARIEIFLLEPVKPSAEISQAMNAAQQVQWKCMIGNLKKWKNEKLELRFGSFSLQAELIDRVEQEVMFSWSARLTFSSVLEKAGKVPLPPYIKREAQPSDEEEYQTVYSKHEGAVAAPTAGLHFTTKVMNQLKKKGFGTSYLTLHVSAGTFKPISVDKVEEHPMHAEQVIVKKKNVIDLIEAKGPRIAVGTTSMRTMESLYWFGVKLMEDPNADFLVEKLTPYHKRQDISPESAFKQVLRTMEQRKLENISGITEIFILPGYSFKATQGLITNFHMPGSTLILLIAAFIGSDWKQVYQEALGNDYRFLSYGDSSLLLPN
jgi:S-adenosylmethionine:tRNA ribosyltransferase-isomerase